MLQFRNLKMADDGNFVDLYFWNSDSDAEFDGFEVEGVNNNNVLPEYDAVEIDGDVNYSSRCRFGLVSSRNS